MIPSPGGASDDVSDEATKTPRPFWWRAPRRAYYLLIPIFVAVASVVAYNQVTAWMMARWDMAQERDPSTGLLIGAEQLDLGPRDAESAVLLVHGFVGAPNNFWEFPTRLAEAGYRVRSVSLPGHGTSPTDLLGVSGDELVQAVLDELRALKEQHDHVFVASHSMGGTLSTLAASIEGCDGLVLAAPYYRVTHQWYYVLPPETWSAMTGWAVSRVYRGDRFVRVNRAEAKEHIVAYRWVPSEATRMLNGLAETARDTDVLDQIECPVLMLHSRSDFAASPAAAEDAFEAIGSSEKELVWLENTDHHVFWDYDRDEAIDSILAFLEKLAAQ